MEGPAHAQLIDDLKARAMNSGSVLVDEISIVVEGAISQKYERYYDNAHTLQSMRLP